MFCTRCGKKLNYESRFCVDCARKLAQDAALAKAEANAGELATDPDTHPAVIPSTSAVRDTVTPDTNSAVIPSPTADGDSVTSDTNSAVITSPSAVGDQNTSEKKTNIVGTATKGLGKAIASAAMSEISLILAYGIVYLSVAMTPQGFILLLGALGLAICSLVFGILSITTFARCRKACGAGPIATLVLGIVGLATSALAIINILFFLFVILLIIAAFGGLSF